MSSGKYWSSLLFTSSIVNIKLLGDYPLNISLTNQKKTKFAFNMRVYFKIVI